MVAICWCFDVRKENQLVGKDLEFNSSQSALWSLSRKGENLPAHNYRVHALLNKVNL